MDVFLGTLCLLDSDPSSLPSKTHSRPLPGIRHTPDRNSIGVENRLEPPEEHGLVLRSVELLQPAQNVRPVESSLIPDDGCHVLKVPRAPGEDLVDDYVLRPCDSCGDAVGDA